jgi:chromosome segregation ATPase
MEQNRILEIILAKMDDMKANNAESMAKMECLLADNREMKATIRSGQEETRAAINSIRSELEEKINAQTQGLREELDEARQHLQVAMTSIDTWTGTLQDDITHDNTIFKFLMDKYMENKYIFRHSFQMNILHQNVECAHMKSYCHI